MEENKDDYEIVHIAHFSLDLFSESFMEELRLMIMEEKDCKDYMCNNCGGGFTKEEMFFDDSNDHDVCTPCFVATEQYKDAEFPKIDKRMANASEWPLQNTNVNLVVVNTLKNKWQWMLVFAKIVGLVVKDISTCPTNLL